MGVLFQRLATVKVPTIREVVGRSPESVRFIPGRDAEVPEPARVGPGDPVLTAVIFVGRPGQGSRGAAPSPPAAARRRVAANATGRPAASRRRASRNPRGSFRETTPARRSEPVSAPFRRPAFGKAGAVRDLGRVSEPAGSVSGAGAAAVEPAGAIPGAIPGGPVRTTALSAGFTAAGIPRSGAAPVFAGPEPGRRRRGPASRGLAEKGLADPARSFPGNPPLHRSEPVNARLRSPALGKAGAVREAIGRVPEPDGSVSGAGAAAVEPAGAIPGGPLQTTALCAGFTAAGIPRGGASPVFAGPEPGRRRRCPASRGLAEKGLADPARSFPGNPSLRRSEPVKARLRAPALGKAGAVREAIGRVPEPDGSVSGAEAPAVEPAGAIPGGPVRTTALSAGSAASGISRSGAAPVFAGPDSDRRRRGPASRPFPERGLTESARSFPGVPNLAEARR